MPSFRLEGIVSPSTLACGGMLPPSPFATVSSTSMVFMGQKYITTLPRVFSRRTGDRFAVTVSPCDSFSSCILFCKTSGCDEEVMITCFDSLAPEGWSLAPNKFLKKEVYVFIVHDIRDNN